MSTTMDRAIPMSRWNKILLVVSLSCATFCLIVEQCAGFTSLPVYVPIVWAISVATISTWFSFFLLKKSLKANSPLLVRPLTPWIKRRLAAYLALDGHDEKSKIKQTDIRKIVKDLNAKFIGIWYKTVSDDKTFGDEANEMLEKLFERLLTEIRTTDEIRLARKLADVFLLHLKEHRRALRRAERAKATEANESYRCTHPGSRGVSALEYVVHRLVSVLAIEFLQWELTSSLPCKLLISVLAKRLLTAVRTISQPRWIFENSIAVLQCAVDEEKDETSKGVDKNGIVSKALGDGMASATAAVVPRPLPKSGNDENPRSNDNNNHDDDDDDDDDRDDNDGDGDKESSSNSRRNSLILNGLTAVKPPGHRGLWADVNVSQADSEGDEDRISPIYEEPTDFATTIARLRNVLEQKSTANTPLQPEERSYVVYEGNQFTNLVIPWTEFHTAQDGSQQLLYCIQFDDVEQHGVDTFETTTATVRRRYADFAQLHANLEEVPSFGAVMSEINLPEGGGRTDMENYLRTVCTRLSGNSPPQLRNFLRPSSGSGKKADAVAPRLDRFLAKTVTGVFNTLKTVVPGFEMDQDDEIQPLPTLMPLSDIPWRFVENTKHKNLAIDLQQLVAERIDYCSVDEAYEAVDSVDGSGDSEMLALWLETVNTPYDEELEELDCRLSMSCVFIDLLCELLAGIGSNNTIQQEAIVRWSKLFLGNITEPLITSFISKRSIDIGNKLSVSLSLSQSSGPQMDYSDEPIENVKDRLSRLLQHQIPSGIVKIFGEEDTRDIVMFILGSFDNRKANLDLTLRIIDVLASELLASCRTRSVQTI